MVFRHLHHLIRCYLSYCQACQSCVLVCLRKRELAWQRLQSISTSTTYFSCDILHHEYPLLRSHVDLSHCKKMHHLARVVCLCCRIMFSPAHELRKQSLCHQSLIPSLLYLIELRSLFWFLLEDLYCSHLDSIALPLRNTTARKRSILLSESSPSYTYPKKARLEQDRDYKGR